MEHIRSFFTCPITQSICSFPVFCPCGHVFEAEAIYKWLETHSNCPVSRLPLSLSSLVYLPLVKNFLTGYTESSNMQVQTDTFDPFVPPFAYYGDDEPLDYDDEINSYIDKSRLVHFNKDSEYFNPQSKNPHVGPVVQIYNSAYLARLLPRVVEHAVVVIRKYLYSSRSDSLIEISRGLCRQGYFVYDIFMYKNTGDLKVYCILSCDVMKDKSPNRLSMLKKINLTTTST